MPCGTLRYESRISAISYTASGTSLVSTHPRPTDYLTYGPPLPPIFTASYQLAIILLRRCGAPIYSLPLFLSRLGANHNDSLTGDSSTPVVLPSSNPSSMRLTRPIIYTIPVVTIIGREHFFSKVFSVPLLIFIPTPSFSTQPPPAFLCPLPLPYSHPQASPCHISSLSLPSNLPRIASITFFLSRCPPLLSSVPCSPPHFRQLETSPCTPVPLVYPPAGRSTHDV